MVGFSLDDATSIFGFESPQHIKIDVDGSEYKIIEGMKKTLKDKRLKSVLIEISSEDDYKKIYTMFTKLDFKLKDQGSNKKSQEAHNYIFLR